MSGLSVATRSSCRRVMSAMAHPNRQRLSVAERNALVDDLEVLNLRLQRARRMLSGVSQVEFSPQTRRLAKMVGCMELMVSSAE